VDEFLTLDGLRLINERTVAAIGRTSRNLDSDRPIAPEAVLLWQWGARGFLDLMSNPLSPR